MKVFVTLPTFNESKNIEPLIRQIHRQDPGIGIVVADDDSPDGTWKVVEEISKKTPASFFFGGQTKAGVPQGSMPFALPLRSRPMWSSKWMRIFLMTRNIFPGFWNASRHAIWSLDQGPLPKGRIKEGRSFENGSLISHLFTRGSFLVFPSGTAIRDFDASGENS